MQNFIIETDSTGRELTSHGNEFFPIQGYDEYFSQFILGEVSWHWHDEIELIVVVEGSTLLEYMGNTLKLNTGEAVFINSNILHRLTQIGYVDCHILNFVLNPEFIGGKLNSSIYQKYIEPICSNIDFPLVKFSPNIPWESAAIEKLRSSLYAFFSKETAYELKVRNDLSEFWYLLITNMKNIIQPKTPDSLDTQRMNKILKYIHKNISSKLTTKLLSNAANISESECYRLFKRSMNVTPGDYIMNYRLQLATLKLVESNQSILELTMDLGFKSPSYFTKKFKDKYSVTPTKFRKINAN